MVESPPGSRKGFYDCPVVSVKNLSGAIYLMRLHCPALAEDAHPGQFVNVKVNNDYIPLLRKPFSICRRHEEEGWIEILWKIVGKGTEALSGYRPGQQINVLGPLGRGYSIRPDLELAILVGGGLGVAPLPFLCQELLQVGKKVEVFLGAKSEKELAFVRQFLELGVEVFVTTEDGSVGEKGLITELLIERLKKSFPKPAIFFCCGPTGFLNSMIRISESFDIDGQMAIETMMGCGFGICVGCPVRIRDSKPGERWYKLTCLDGPVFGAREVVLDD
ncbi:MAG TPA: dihydroorotate dehydrogenase electron transfer subunit [bacterium]